MRFGVVREEEGDKDDIECEDQGGGDGGGHGAELVQESSSESGSYN